jgi:hypothetical protein
MGVWRFAYLVPHITFREPIENDYLALVPPSDARLLGLSATHEAVRVLTQNLTDQFGRSVEPSALLVHQNAIASVDFYAVLSFRNAIAVSSLVDGWSLMIGGGTAHYPLWSDYFDLYPFTASKKGDELIAKSMALTSIDKPGSFCGKIAPHLPNNHSLASGFDEHLLDYLLAEWKAHFINKRTERRTRVLFRSLEVAAQASRMPATGTRVPTIHDLGVAIGLWASAFEVLTHPGSGPANKYTVVDCIGKADWLDRELKAKRYLLKSNAGSVMRKMNFSQRLYMELYRARNDFLHGNHVTDKSLFPFKKVGLPILTSCAVLVYRAAIAGFAPPQSSRKTASKSITEKLAAHLEYLRKVQSYEDAMKHILKESRK